MRSRSRASGGLPGRIRSSPRGSSAVSHPAEGFDERGEHLAGDRVCGAHGPGLGLRPVAPRRKDAGRPGGEALEMTDQFQELVRLECILVESV